MFDARHLEPALTAQEQLLRDHFVSEYMKDWNGVKACLRLGFQTSYATMWAEKLLQDGYVQRKIAFMTTAPAASPEQDIMDKALVEATLRKVMQCGSDSARVAAARELNAMKGWSKPQDTGEANEDLVEAFRRVAQELPS